jgi:hypothetical protein
MALIRQLTGDTANLFGCDLPCFAIEGFTGNTFFTPCSSCVASTNYEANHAWDGVFRPVIPVVVNEKNVWDGCTYGFVRNGSGYKAAIHNGKNLYEPGPGFGGSLTIDSRGSTITIRCLDSSDVSQTTWKGTSSSKHPDELPFTRSEGCSGRGSITLRKISGLPCICEEAGPDLICPEAGGDCVDCDNPVTDCASTPIYCFRIFISGFATSPTGVGTCDVLNGEQFIVDSISSGCAYTTGAVVPNPEHGVSKFSNDGIIQCIDDPADGTGFWRFHDGVTHVARGRISSANEDSACPPHSATFPVEGLCYCNGQFGTATMSYGPCPCLGTNEGSCPDSYPCS